MNLPASPFGPTLVAVVTMLRGGYGFSVRKVREALRETLSFDVSTGAISAMEACASEALASVHEEVHEAVHEAELKHADATSWTHAGILMGLWVVATEFATAYFIRKNSKRESLLTILSRQLGVLVSDRSGVFMFWKMRYRQVCWAHLLSLFVGFAGRDGPGGDVGKELLGLHQPRRTRAVRAPRAAAHGGRAAKGHTWGDFVSLRVL